MTALAPGDWKKTVERLRDDIVSSVDRWLPRRVSKEPMAENEPMAAPFLREGGPNVDLEETDDEFLVTAELPGLEKDDFTVEIMDNRLVLRGEKRSGREERKSNYYFSECSYGSFARAFELPCEVDTEQAKGDFKNGVLKLTLPKTEAAKAKRVKVNVN